MHLNNLSRLEFCEERWKAVPQYLQKPPFALFNLLAATRLDRLVEREIGSRREGILGGRGRREEEGSRRELGGRRLIKDLNTEPALWADYYCQKRKQILKGKTFQRC